MAGCGEAYIRHVVYQKASGRLLRHFAGSDETEVIGQALVCKEN